MPTIRISRRTRILAALLLLPALALRALIPSGFMPGTHAGLGIAMQLCTSQGMQTVIVNPDGSIEQGAPASHHDAPCSYALSGGAAPLPELTHSPSLSVPSATFVAFAPAPAVSLPSIVRAHTPRGPPAIAA